MDVQIARYAHQLRPYIKEIKGLVLQNFPDAQFGRLYRGSEDEVMLPVYVKRSDELKVLDATMDAMDRAWENNVKIFVDPCGLSSHKKTRTNAYPQS